VRPNGHKGEIHAASASKKNSQCTQRLRTSRRNVARLGGRDAPWTIKQPKKGSAMRTNLKGGALGLFGLKIAGDPDGKLAEKWEG